MSNDIEKELEQMSAEMTDTAETPLPSIEEQKAIVAKLKQLEAEGKLTPKSWKNILVILMMTTPVLFINAIFTGLMKFTGLINAC